MIIFPSTTKSNYDICHEFSFNMHVPDKFRISPAPPPDQKVNINRWYRTCSRRSIFIFLKVESKINIKNIMKIDYNPGTPLCTLNWRCLLISFFPTDLYFSSITRVVRCYGVGATIRTSSERWPKKTKFFWHAGGGKKIQKIGGDVQRNFGKILWKF